MLAMVQSKTSAVKLGAAIESELVDDRWLALAAAVPADERARMLASPEATRSTTVDPELAEALYDHRRAVERCARVSYAFGFALRHGRIRAIERLLRLAVAAQVSLESSLECVEMIVGAGR